MTTELAETPDSVWKASRQAVPPPWSKSLRVPDQVYSSFTQVGPASLPFGPGKVLTAPALSASKAKVPEATAMIPAEYPAVKLGNKEFKPDFTPQQLKDLGVYASVYDKSGPRLASLPEWKPEWLSEHDPKGWLEWYENYNKGRRIPGEDERQIKRWLSFKARHGGPFTANPTPRRGWALVNWGVDPIKLVTSDRVNEVETMLSEYKNRAERVSDERIKKYASVYSGFVKVAFVGMGLEMAMRSVAPLKHMVKKYSKVGPKGALDASAIKKGVKGLAKDVSKRPFTAARKATAWTVRQLPGAAAETAIGATAMAAGAGAVNMVAGPVTPRVRSPKNHMPAQSVV